MGKFQDVSQHTGAIKDKRNGSLIKTLLTPMDNALLNRTLNTPGLTIGSSSKKKVKIANNLLCMIKGKPVAVASQEVAFTATTHDISDGYINCFVVNVDSAGTCYLTMGKEIATATGIGSVIFPDISDDRAVLGVVTIAAAAAIFNATTDDLDAGTLTVAYYDCVGPYCYK